MRVARVTRSTVWSVVLGIAASSAVAEAATPKRYAWAGLERGPLSPTRARTLETLLVDELDGYDSFRLVDASGHALDLRLLASEAALVAKLKDEGIDRFLRFKHKSALKKFNQAIGIFESRLVTLENYELLHDTLLAKSEAQYQSGERGAAKATLKHLIALSPKVAPSKNTHPAKFVRLWEAAKREMGAVGSIAVECSEPGCIVQVDGQPLGEAPLLATRMIPGKHYVVATWPHGVLKTTVRVAPGREVKARLSRRGPAEEARRDLLGVIARRSGANAATEPSAKVAALSRAWATLVTAVKKDANGRRWLLLAKHASKGKLLAVGRMPLIAKVDSEIVARDLKRLCAAMFVDRRKGEFQVDATGSLSDVPGLTELLYASGGPRTAAPPPPFDGTKAPPPPPPPDIVGVVSPPDLGDDEDGLTDRWWFWALVGGVAVAGATVAGVVLLSPDPTTTKFEVRLP